MLVREPLDWQDIVATNVFIAGSDMRLERRQRAHGSLGKSENELRKQYNWSEVMLVDCTHAGAPQEELTPHLWQAMGPASWASRAFLSMTTRPTCVSARSTSRGLMKKSGGEHWRRFNESSLRSSTPTDLW